MIPSVGMSIPQKSLADMKAGFFYDQAGNVMRQGLAEADHRAQSQMGAYVRRTARHKLSRKPRMKTLAEMSTDEFVAYQQAMSLHKDKPLNQTASRLMTKAERRKFHIRQKSDRRRGYRHPKPRRPRAAAKRGAPPRRIVGLLWQHTYFAFDAGSKSTVVGPSTLNGLGSAPEILEEGGYTRATFGEQYGKSIRVEPHPYMRPALDENLGKFPELFRDSVTDTRQLLLF